MGNASLCYRPVRGVFGVFITPGMSLDELRDAFCPDGPLDLMEEDLPMATPVELFLGVWRMCRPRYWHKLHSGRMSNNVTRQGLVHALEGLARKQMHVRRRLGFQKDIVNKTMAKPLVRCQVTPGMINRNQFFSTIKTAAHSVELTNFLRQCEQFYLCCNKVKVC